MFVCFSVVGCNKNNSTVITSYLDYSRIENNQWTARMEFDTYSAKGVSTKIDRGFYKEGYRLSKYGGNFYVKKVWNRGIKYTNTILVKHWLYREKEYPYNQVVIYKFYLSSHTYLLGKYYSFFRGSVTMTDLFDEVYVDMIEDTNKVYTYIVKDIIDYMGYMGNFDDLEIIQ
jgi:hypothetical protein